MAMRKKSTEADVEGKTVFWHPPGLEVSRQWENQPRKVRVSLSYSSVPSTENETRKCMSSHLRYLKLGKLKPNLSFYLRKERKSGILHQKAS